MSYLIKYPRKTILRNSLRAVGRGIMPLLARSQITGLEKFPKKGPLIVVGNHTGAMEVVMMALYAPKIVEFFAGVDMGWVGITGYFVELYGIIPVVRGNTSHKTLKMGIDVLAQDGMLGIFPEGGFWEPGKNKAESGAAWLSYMAQAPILPIGFGDTRGKLSELFKLKRPDFEMNVGDVLPPVQLNKGMKKKDALQLAADEIMDAIWQWVPEDERRKKAGIEDEDFFLEVDVYDQAQQRVVIPGDLAVTEGSWFSRFIHRLNLINSMRDYVHLPVQVLKELDQRPPASDLHLAVDSVLNYVEAEYPQFFTYRYGQVDGTAMQTSFRQVRALMQWVMDHDYSVQAEARYEYTDPETGAHVVRKRPLDISQW